MADEEQDKPEGDTPQAESEAGTEAEKPAAPVKKAAPKKRSTAKKSTVKKKAATKKKTVKKKSSVKKSAAAAATAATTSAQKEQSSEMSEDKPNSSEKQEAVRQRLDQMGMMGSPARAQAGATTGDRIYKVIVLLGGLFILWSLFFAGGSQEDETDSATAQGDSESVPSVASVDDESDEQAGEPATISGVASTTVMAPRESADDDDGSEQEADTSAEGGEESAVPSSGASIYDGRSGAGAAPGANVERQSGDSANRQPMMPMHPYGWYPPQGYQMPPYGYNQYAPQGYGYRYPYPQQYYPQQPYQGGNE